MKGGETLKTVLLAGVLAIAAPMSAQGGDQGRASNTPQVGPLLTVEEPTIDLGEIKAGTDAVATFIFHNRGDVDVKIIRAKPS
ncbi:MAG: hypothetical protein V2I67_11010 [Thermoanaerobaculales bacterium]|jgi:hypothetical protein|nr:hypothetical protein [Thermoanaerobaculales bacterium]